jgi:pimeloyl-ACP methyl ester carboxylesterase
MTARHGVVRHDGLEIHYSDVQPDGEPIGPPLVLVHGLFLSHHLFDRLVERLPARRVITVDLRGHGRSTRPLEAYRYSWQLLGDDVVAVLDDLGIEQAVIGGLSLGAGVTVALAHVHPDRMAGMIVEMPVLGRSEGFARVFFGLAATAFRLNSLWLGALTRPLRHLPEPPGPSELKLALDVARLHPIAAAALIEGLSASELPIHDRATLSTISIPTLVIGHRFDPIHDLADAALLAERLPEAELVEVAHIAAFRLEPDRYAQVITDFLDRKVPVAG